MSLAITHFVVGAALTLAAATILLPRLRFQRTLVVLGGAWAMLPDMNHVSPSRLGVVDSIHDGELANLFWAHNFLDALDATDSNEAAVVAVCFLFFVTVLVDSAGYLRPSTVTDGGRTNSDTRRPFSGRGGFASRRTDGSETGRFARSVEIALAVCALVVGVGVHGVVFQSLSSAGVQLTPGTVLLSGLGVVLELTSITVLARNTGVTDLIDSAVPSWISSLSSVGLALSTALVVVAVLASRSAFDAFGVPVLGVVVLLTLSLVRIWNRPR
jgi:hypothetical protein